MICVILLIENKCIGMQKKFEMKIEDEPEKEGKYSFFPDFSCSKISNLFLILELEIRENEIYSKKHDGQLDIADSSMSDSLKDLLTLFIFPFFGSGSFCHEKSTILT